MKLLLQSLFQEVLTLLNFGVLLIKNQEIFLYVGATFQIVEVILPCT